jgi:hypothetical protein
MGTEEALDFLAQRRGIDRYDEHTFDSGDFPKVIFRDQVTDDDVCGVCGEKLDDIVVLGARKVAAQDLPPELSQITNSDLRSYISESDWYDPWGASMGWHFAIADWVTDQGGDIPGEWGYRPSMGGSEREAPEYQALEEGNFPVADVEQAGAVLHKLEDRLKAEGKDY